MKTLFTLFTNVIFSAFVFCQTDTISYNIFQNNGNLGIGTDEPAIKLHIVDSNFQILLGHQPEYDGPYVNIHASPGNEPGPMVAIGVAKRDFLKDYDTLAMKYWAYLYGNNLNSGIGILPDMQFASKGFYIKRDGKMGINTKLPKVELDVNGSIRVGFSETNLPGNIRFTGNDFEGYNGTTWLSFTDLSYNPWQQINNEIYYNQGNVGIGTNSPNNALTIEGDETGWPGRIFFSVKNKSAGSNSLAYMAAEAGTSGNHSVFGHISETYTANDSPEELQDYGWISSNGNGLIICASKNNLKPGIIKFLSGQSSGTTFDERMRIDSTGNVGIGTKQPNVELDVNGGIKIGYSETNLPGNIRFTGTDFEGYNGTTWLSLSENNTIIPRWESNQNGLYFLNGNIGIGTDTMYHPFSVKGTITNAVLEFGNNNYGGVNYNFIQSYDREADVYRDLKLITKSGAEGGTMYLDTQGNVGIGTINPMSKLHISEGDIYISDINYGIIMKSPDGQCWRGTIDNTGTLNFTIIECPNEPTGLGESEKTILKQSVLIYPNPTGDILNIEIKDKNEKVQYSVYNTSGKMVQNGKIRNYVKTIDISNLERGVYIFEFKDLENNIIAVQKVIKD